MARRAICDNSEPLFEKMILPCFLKVLPFSFYIFIMKGPIRIVVVKRHPKEFIDKNPFLIVFLDYLLASGNYFFYTYPSHIIYFAASQSYLLFRMQFYRRS